MLVTLPLISGMPAWMGWLYGAIAGVAAVTDYRSGKIYNWLTLPALALGLIVAGFEGWATILSATAGVGVAAAVFIPLFLTGIFGGGDAKLLMALGTVLGAGGVFLLICVSILIAGAGAVALLFVHRRAGPFAREVFAFLRSVFTPGLDTQWPRLNREIKAPFGIAVFFALIFVFAGGQL